jgi:glucose-1-phosphate thymidylyltransferase
MNLWAVTPELVEACRRVPPSSRGELELPEAVALALREGVAVRAVRLREPVLDLSRRADIAAVVERLSLVDPRP